MFAAFEQNEFLQPNGGGSKILLTEACLLPLSKMSFFVPMAVAAKSRSLMRVCCL